MPSGQYNKKHIAKSKLRRLVNKHNGSLLAITRELGWARETVRRLLREHDLYNYARSFCTQRAEKESSEADVLKQELEVYKSIKKPIKAPKWLLPKKKKPGHQISTLVLSDWHFAEVVDPKDIEFANGYDCEIAAKRLHNCIDNTIRVSRDYTAGTICDGLVVALGGDIVSGIIHEELEKTNESPLLQSMREAGKLLIAGINELAKHFPNIYVPCVVGNHGRLNRKVTFKGAVQDNIDWAIYMMIADYFEGHGTIKVDVATSSEMDYQVYNTKFRLSHGNEFRGGSGVIGPVYPVLRGNKRKVERQNVLHNPYDFLIIGHWHNTIPEMHGVIQNGSIKGFDEYAYENQFLPGPPTQVFFTTDPTHGLGQMCKIRCLSKDEPWMEKVPNREQIKWMK